MTPGFRRLQRFAVVGTAGFCVDAGILTWLMGAGWNILLARLVSFSMAVTATWLLNRRWTFRDSRVVNDARRYALYTAIQVLGALINLSIFTLLIMLYLPLRDYPWLPLGAAAFFALAFNYVATHRLIFKNTES